MKVLHIWNTAGVATTLAKFQRKLLGWDTLVITRSRFDPYGYTQEGPGKLVGGSKYRFFSTVLYYSTRYDVLHVHSVEKMVKYLDIMNKIFFRNKKKIIIHYHGSDLRGRGNEEQKRKVYEIADVILVATGDLLDEIPSEYRYKTYYVPNPVDTELFRPLGLQRKNKGLVLVKIYRSSMWPKIRSVAEELKERYNVDYEVLFAEKTPIHYADMPKLLNRYKYFFDMPHDFTNIIYEALSKTALEALACGTKVLTPRFGVLESLPREHTPDYAVKLIEKIINKI